MNENPAASGGEHHGGRSAGRSVRKKTDGTAGAVLKVKKRWEKGKLSARAAAIEQKSDTSDVFEVGGHGKWSEKCAIIPANILQISDVRCILYM